MSEQPQKQKNFLERLGEVEAQLGQFQQVGTLSRNLRDAFGILVETVDAIIQETGGQDLSDRITARLTAKREEQRVARNDRAKAVLEQLVTNGQLEAVDAVDATTVIIGTESNENGAVTNEYVQTSFDNLVQEARDKINGQGVGFVLEHNGAKLTITGLYRMKAATEPSLSEAAATPDAPLATETATTEAPSTETPA